MYNTYWEKHFTFLCPFQQPWETVGKPSLHPTHDINKHPTHDINKQFQ